MNPVKICFVFITSLFVSCTHQHYSREVESALKQADSNRSELEQVLEHYSKDPADSLKLSAAEFLIANMPGHWSYDKKMLEAYYAEIDIILKGGERWNRKVDTMNVIAQKYPVEHIKDIHVITSDYLISNIEQAFDEWQNGEWARHV
jgi:hypothetical protein